MDLPTALHTFHNWWNGVNKIKTSLKKDANPLRIGVLSAAAINYSAIVDPTQTHPGAALAGIASRDLAKAQAQIDANHLGATCKAYGSYANLLADAAIDAVYIPLPNGLHCEWAIKAMEAGKHVLIEKPMAANANEARQIRETATRTDRVALEAFHFRFHPAARHLKKIIESGQYGDLKSVYVRFNLAKGIVGQDNIRLKYDLAGGACMDLTYVFAACTYFASPDITRCHFDAVEATPRPNESDKKIDEAMDSKFVVESAGKPPVHCHVQADLVTPNLFGLIPKFWTFTPLLTLELEGASIVFNNFVIPSYGHSITITEKDTGRKHTEKCYVAGPQWDRSGEAWYTTYRWQLEAFISMVRAKEAGREYTGPWMSLEESEKVTELIDAVYDKAGLPRRGL